MKPKHSLRSLLFPSLVALVATSTPAHAANYYWDSNGTASGLGNTGSLVWGTSANQGNLTAGAGRTLIDGTIAVVNTATTNADTMFCGTMNLGLGATASTIGIVGTGVTINNITFGIGQGSQGVTLSGGGGTITLATSGGAVPAPAIYSLNSAANTIGAVLAGTAGMTKGGGGTLILTGANSYTGGTTLIGGGTLQVGNGTTGSLTSQALTLGSVGAGAGNFNVAGANANSQNMGALTFSAGDGTITSTAASGSATQTLTFASLAARGVGATGNFVLATNTTAADNKIVLTSTTNAPLSSGSNNQGYFFGGTEYARYDTVNNRFRAVNYGTDANSFAPLSGTTLGVVTSATDVKLNGAITAQTTASVNTINLAGNTLTLQDSGQVLSVNGILSNGGNIATAGTMQATSAGGEMVFNVTGGTLTVNPGIQNNTSASALTKSGAGTLLLAGANSYTGNTHINSGTLAVSGGGAISDSAGSVILANAAGVSFRLDANETIFGLTGGGASGGIVDVQGNTLTIANTANQSFSGTFAGTVGGVITKTGNSTLTLNNANSFAGIINLNEGALTLAYGNTGTTLQQTISSGGAINMAGGTSLNVTPTPQVAFGQQTSNNPAQLNVANSGFVIGNDINITSGTATLNLSGNDNRIFYNGNITGGASGNQTLKVNSLTSSQAYQFTGVVQDGGIGTTLGVSVDATGTAAAANPHFFNFAGLNTFTGPIAVNNSTNSTGGVFFVVGGLRTTSGLTAGSGYLGGGNYSNTIALNTGTILNYASSAAQTLGGVISGNGSLQKDGAGTLTLSVASTYAGTTTINAGTLLLNSGGANTLPTTTGVTFANVAGAVLDLNGQNQTIASLAGGGTTGGNVTLGSNTLTVGGQSATYAGILSGVGGSLIKNGPTSQILSGANTYSGATTINGGTLMLGSGTATGSLNTSSAISVASGAVFAVNQTDTVTQGTDFSGAAISGAGGFTQAGTGTTVLNVANTYQGPTTISAGTLSVAAANNLGNAASNLVFDGGTLQITGTALANFTDLGRTVVFNPGRVVGLDINDAAHTFTFDKTLPTAGLALAGAGTVAFDNSVSALSLNVASGTLTYGGAIINGSGARTVTKTGAGTQILTGANLYSGLTTIQAGTLQVGNGTIGSLNGTTGTDLTFTGTGAFVVREAAASTQGMGALSLSAGDATITSQATASGSAATLTFASLNARAAGATGNFTLVTNTSSTSGTPNRIVFTNTANVPLAGGSNNAGIFFGGSNYARYDAAGYLRAVSYTGSPDTNASTVAAGTTIGATTAASDINITGAITAQNTAAVNTIKTGSAIAQTGGSTLQVNGILTTAGVAIGTAGNNLQTTGAGGDMVFNATTGTTTVAANIINNSSSTLTKTGAGQLTLSGTNTYAGGTFLNAGQLNTTLDNQLGTGGGITVNGTSTWNMGAAVAVTYDRSLTVNEGAVLSLSTGNAGKTVTGVLQGNGAIIGLNSSSYIFSNTGNTFTGALTPGYEMRITSLADSLNAVNLGGNTGGFAWYGGTKTFSDRPFTLSTTGTSMINNNGTGALTITSNIAFSGTAGARTLALGSSGTSGSAAAYTASANVFSGNITDGPGSAVSLTKANAGTWIVSGTNTYTGATTISSGTLAGIGASAFGSTPGISIAAAGTLSLRGDSSTTFANSNVTTSASGSTINVDQSTIAGTGAKTMTMGTLGTTSTAATYQVNFTGANNTSLTVGAVTGSASTAAAQVTLSNSIASGGELTVASYTSANTTGGEELRLGGVDSIGNITGAITPSATTLSVSKIANGTWVLGGSSSYTGATTVQSGTLSINSIGDVGAGNTAVGNPTLANSVIRLGNDTATGTLGYTGGTTSTDRQIQINTNANSATGSGVILNNGSGTLTFSNSTFNASYTNTNAPIRSLTLGGSNNGVIQGVMQNHSATSRLAVIKDDAGKWTLEGNNTYTGTTTVTSGTLLINGNSSLATGAVAVNGGTLGGTGTIGGAVSVADGATLSPGASIQSLATGALTMAANSTFVYEVTDNSMTGADMLGVNGALSLTGVNLDLTLANAALSGGGWIDGNKLTLISYIDGGSGITSGFTGYEDDTDYAFGANVWTFNYNDTTAGNNFAGDLTGTPGSDAKYVTMTYTVIPEPSSALLGALGALLLLRRRR